MHYRRPKTSSDIVTTRLRRPARGADPLVHQSHGALATFTGRACFGLCLLLLTIILASPVAAQRNVVEVTHPGGLMTIQVEDATTFSAVRVTNNVPRYYQWQRPGGRFRLLTGSRTPTGGDPTRIGDENRAIASKIEAGIAGPATDLPSYDRFTSKVTIAVDGEYYDVHALGAAEDDREGAAANYWPVPPQASTRDIYAVARIPLDDDDPNAATEFIEIEHRWTLIHDAVRLEYIVRNNSGEAHTVGLRSMIDASFGQWDRDGGTIVLPSGERIVTERTIPDATTTVLPDVWTAFDRIDDPTVKVRGTLASSDVFSPGTANSAAGMPDQISFGLYRSLGNDAQWDFIPNKALSLEGEDWAYAARWDEVDLAAGRSRRYVTYYGLGAASVDYEAPYALAAYCPNRLSVQSGDDPSTAAVERYYLTDADGNSPFTVYAYADNFSTAALADASVRISLPDGFELDPSTQSLSKSLGTVARNELKRVSWTVRASVARPGVGTVKFTGPNGKTVECDITIPVIPALTPMTSLKGIEMISIPYEFADTSVEHVFQDLGSMHVGGPNGLARWSPEEQLYRWFPHASVSNITPGLGYWFLNLNRKTVFFPEDLQEVNTEWEFSVNLPAGWNQIGSPYALMTNFAGVRVIDSSGSEWSMQEAVARRLVMGTLYSYDAEDNEYEWETELADVSLTPFMGYWLYAYEDVTLLFSPEALYAQSVDEPGVTSSSSPGDWKVGISVAAAGRVRTRSIGMAAGAGDGLDQSDVVAPPAALPDGVVLTAQFTDPQTGAACMEDIRSAGTERQVWDLTVTTNAADQPVTITWPDLSNLPAQFAAYFEDPATGQRRYMRTTTSYQYRSGATGGTRQFKIVVQPMTARNALVQSASAVASPGGVSLVYTLSSDAEVDIEVRNISGVAVRRVAKGKASTMGVNTLAWDGRNEHGARVPSGRYLFSVTARSPESGEQHSVVRSFQLSR